jgi:NAD(P)-dependent dehydrogenase (short-subunit alcohol dehydrogenase family)
MLFTVALAERLGSRGLLTFSLYPGRCLTNIVRNMEVGMLQKLGKSNQNHFSNTNLTKILIYRHRLGGRQWCTSPRSKAEMEELVHGAVDAARGRLRPEPQR